MSEAMIPGPRDTWAKALADHRMLVLQTDITRGEPRTVRLGHYFAGFVSELYELAREQEVTPRAISEAGDVLWYVQALAVVCGVSAEALVVRLSIHPTTTDRLGPAVGALAAAVQRHIRDGREPDSAQVADWLAIIIDHARDRAGCGIVRILAENETKLRARLARGTIQGAGGAR
jgi:hypothetical protein